MAKKKKKVTVYKMPKAQEGMQMAEQAPQQQGGGQDQMQQIAMQVQQMLEQGADPGQVIAQLLQGGVPPEVIAQIFVGLGMPQEQVAPMIEQVMQQMQGAQQQAPPQGQPMMQGGGEAEQQAMMQEYIIVFAAMNQADPQEIMQAIESGQLDFAQIQKVVESPEGQEAAMQLQQMAQAQQGAGPQQQVMKGGGMVPMGYHTMPDGSIMADSDHKDDGGMVTEVMMGAINPTKKDFLKLKKKMLKEYKGGGTTPKACF
jgi:ribosomal protein S16